MLLSPAHLAGTTISALQWGSFESLERPQRTSTTQQLCGSSVALVYQEHHILNKRIKQSCSVQDAGHAPGCHASVGRVGC